MGTLTAGYVSSAQSVQISVRSPGFSNVLPNGTSYGVTSSSGNVTINVQAFFTNTTPAATIYFAATCPGGTANNVACYFQAMRIA